MMNKKIFFDFLDGYAFSLFIVITLSSLFRLISTQLNLELYMHLSEIIEINVLLIVGTVTSLYLKLSKERLILILLISIVFSINSQSSYFLYFLALFFTNIVLNIFLRRFSKYFWFYLFFSLVIAGLLISTLNASFLELEYILVDSLLGLKDFGFVFKSILIVILIVLYISPLTFIAILILQQASGLNSYFTLSLFAFMSCNFYILYKSGYKFNSLFYAYLAPWHLFKASLSNIWVLVFSAIITLFCFYINEFFLALYLDNTYTSPLFMVFSEMKNFYDNSLIFFLLIVFLIPLTFIIIIYKISVKNRLFNNLKISL